LNSVEASSDYLVKELKMTRRADKALSHTFVLLFWLSTGGLMMVHVISWLVGASSLILAILGIFMPPVGLINALIFIFTGNSLARYF
jgi:hypothetical protein